MKSTIAAKRRREGYLFILPGFLYMLIILGYPLVYNIILSFKNVNVKTMAYPGFPTDLQPQMTALLSVAKGKNIHPLVRKRKGSSESRVGG